MFISTMFLPYSGLVMYNNFNIIFVMRDRWIHSSTEYR